MPLENEINNNEEINSDEFMNADGESLDISDIDFSDFSSADAKSSLKKIHKKLDKKHGGKTVHGKTHQKGATYHKSNAHPHPKVKVIVPDDRKITIERVSQYILDQSAKTKAAKNFGWYKGEKLKTLIFTFNNDSALDFNFSLFDPSMPLDYFMTTGLNLNNKISVAGSTVAYSDVVYNILANPTLIVHAKFVVSGALLSEQINEALQFENKDIDGRIEVHPFQTLNLIDIMQVQNDIIMFDVQKDLPFTFIPDGVDVINYKVFAGMTVTFAFYYKQISLKEVLFKKEMEKDKHNKLED